MDQKTLKEFLEKNFNLNDQQWSQILNYKNYLQEWNKKMNLTRLDSEDKVYGDYFYESIVPFTKVKFNNVKKILDIGSGSGIPGIILAIIFPKIEITVLDSNNKKCNFLSNLTKAIKLNNCRVIKGRAETLAYDFEEQYDLVTSRAVANLNAILELSARYVAIGGVIIETKTANDTNYNTTLIEKLGLEFLEQNNFRSLQGFNHCLLIFKKRQKTKPPYPRSWKLIKDSYAS